MVRTGVLGHGGVGDGERAGWTVAALSDEGFPGNGTIDDSVKVSGDRGIGGERWMGKRKNGGGGGTKRVSKYVSN